MKSMFYSLFNIMQRTTREAIDALYSAEVQERIVSFVDSDTLYKAYGLDVLADAGLLNQVIGDAGDNLLFGSENRDFVKGNAGNDLVFSDDEADILLGDSDNDTLSAQGGDDTALGGEGNDEIYLDDPDIFADSVLDGADVGAGGAGNDTIYAGGKDDVLLGEEGNNFLSGQAGNDIIHAGKDASELHAGQGDDTLYGSAEGDVIYAGEGADVIFSDAGDDFIAGNLGQDVALTGNGNDTFFADEGDDIAYGGSGHDWLSGWSGNDTLDGGLGNDTLMSGTGRDSIFGGYDNDLIIAGDAQEMTNIHALNWGLLYYGEEFNVADLASAKQDMLVISYAKHADPYTLRSEQPWEADEIATIQAAGKEVFGYINVAEYSSYYEEWEDAWNDAATRAEWLIEAETDITFKVDFTHPEFQHIVKGRVGTLIDSGFDGAILDDALEYYFRVPDGLSGQEYDDAVAIQAVKMQEFILDIRAFADVKILQRDSELTDENRFDLMVNGAPFIGLDALNTDLSDAQRDAIEALHADYLDAIDYQLVENFISMHPEFIPTVKEVYAGSDVQLLSIDTDQPSSQQKAEVILDALDAGFSPYVSDNSNYNILSQPYSDYIALDNVSAASIDGGQGTDTIVAYFGKHTIDGGSEVDFVDYSHAKTGLQVNLKDASFNAGAAEGQLLRNVENVIGTDHDDVIYGNDDANSIKGGEGDDIINGRAGEDTLVGGRGDDKLHADEGNTWLIGGAGRDSLYGGIDDDVLMGKDGANILSGGAGADSFVFEKAHHNVFSIGEADIITDFAVGEDMLDVSRLGFNGFDATLDAANGTVLRAEYDADADMTYIINDGLDFAVALLGDVTASLSDSDFVF